MALSSESSSLLQYNNLQIPQELQVVIVYTEWNEEIVGELLQGALKVLRNFPEVEVLSCRVPGCIEIPHAIQRIPKALKPGAVIAFGCVIRGETPHFDYVCQSVTQGITQLNITASYPVIFGILTVDKEEQAWDRLGGKHGHKGEEAAIAALKMSSLQYTKIK